MEYNAKECKDFYETGSEHICFCNNSVFVCVMLSHCVCLVSSVFCCRIVTGNNTNNKSESDQEDNDDVNDNDWSYGAEKKGDVLLLLCKSAITNCMLNVDRMNEWWLHVSFSFTAKKRKSDKVLFV